MRAPRGQSIHNNTNSIFPTGGRGFPRSANLDGWCLYLCRKAYRCVNIFFRFKNIIYKNIKSEICPKAKNMLRIFSALLECESENNEFPYSNASIIWLYSVSYESENNEFPYSNASIIWLYSVSYESKTKEFPYSNASIIWLYSVSYESKTNEFPYSNTSIIWLYSVSYAYISLQFYDVKFQFCIPTTTSGQSWLDW